MKWIGERRLSAGNPFKNYLGTMLLYISKKTKLLAGGIVLWGHIPFPFLFTRRPKKHIDQVLCVFSFFKFVKIFRCLILKFRLRILQLQKTNSLVMFRTA